MTDHPSNDELVQHFPDEPITHDNAPHYRGRFRRELLVNRCDECRAWHAPPKPVCPACWSWDVMPTPVSGDGVIFMNVFLHEGPPAPGVDYSTPYPVVTVELEEQVGLRFTATVADASNDDIRICKPVRVDWAGTVGFSDAGLRSDWSRSVSPSSRNSMKDQVAIAGACANTGITMRDER